MRVGGEGGIGGREGWRREEGERERERKEGGERGRERGRELIILTILTEIG